MLGGEIWREKLINSNEGILIEIWKHLGWIIKTLVSV